MTEYIDIIFTVVILLLAFRGFLQGFVKEFFTLGAPALGLLGGFLFFKMVGDIIREEFMHDTEGIPEILAFVAIFLAIFLVCKLVQKILSDIINGLKLSSLNKILGCFFGVIEGVAVVAVLLFLANMMPVFDKEELMRTSVFAQYLLPFITKNIHIPFPEKSEPLTPAFLYIRSRIFAG